MKNITPQQITAWIGTAQLLTGAGIQIAGLIQGWIGQAHPALTPAETQTVYAAIMADDTVRATLAEQASHSNIDTGSDVPGGGAT